MDLNKNFLTPDEAAKRLKVCTRTVLRAVERGEIESARFGKTVRIPADARIEKNQGDQENG